MGPCLSLQRSLSVFPRVSRLASEKRELEVQLGRSREEALAGRAARQEAEALRGLVRGLELELRQERGLGHRVAGRRGQDCRRLAKEVSSGGPGVASETWTSASAWASASAWTFAPLSPPGSSRRRRHRSGACAPG